jgi:YebC/PmpR family DNA-binding regulatory protein
MSGHSKWANIKRKKEKSDSKKGKVFTKLGREIAVAVKEGGPDTYTNSKLADVVAKAKYNNMPNDNIEKCIKKAAGEMSGTNYEYVTYEGYGPGGVAVIVETMTDNRNRTAGEVRHFFDKYGGNLGTTGCVSFMFNKMGVLIIENSKKIDEETLMMEAIEAGAEDFKADPEFFEIVTDPQDLSAVRKALESKYELVSAEISMIPTTYIKLDNKEHIALLEKLIDNIDDMDDVQNIYYNWEQDEEQ